MESRVLKRPLLRFDKLALFADIGYEPHPGQLLVHRSKARRRVMACGTRFGKSKCASMEAVAGLLEPKDATLGWLVAPTYDLAQRIMQRVVITAQTKFGHRVREIDPRHQRLVITNLAGGLSELRGKSADQPVSLLGESVDFLIVDEAAKLRRDVWEEYLSPRLIDRKGWSLLVSTPDGPGWFHEEFRRGQRNRDPETESWALPSRDNPHIDPAVIEAERARLDPDRFSQQYEARFIGVEEEPCETCGGWDSNIPFWGLPTLLPGEALRKCPDCGTPVDEDGHTILHHKGEFLLVHELMNHQTERIAEELAYREWKRQSKARIEAGLEPEPEPKRKNRFDSESWGKPESSHAPKQA